MKLHKLEEFKGGWFVGDFCPALHKSTEIEVAVKNYIAGQSEHRHVHRLATEWTVICRGRVEMNGKAFTAGDVVEIPPGESTDFCAITDAVTTVVKCPSIPSDKYVLSGSDS